MPDPVSASRASKLGLFDATMIVMGGVVGSGIFINPYVVAQHVHSSAQILATWGRLGYLRPLRAVELSATTVGGHAARSASTTCRPLVAHSRVKTRVSS
jgi:hypothetical protein